jgi:hypothetical protein
MAARSPILVVWEAMNLLTELESRYGCPDLEQTLDQAEVALINLVVALGRRPEVADSAERPCANLIPFMPRTRIGETLT